MARVTNKLMQGLSGEIDGLIYRTRNGKTFVSSKPRFRGKMPFTDAQEKVRLRFMDASKYAREVVKDPALSNLYRRKAKKGRSIYQLAFRDAYHAPVIQEVIATGYQGAAGDQILVRARDDFRVASVKVIIYGPSGAIVERGEAVPDLIDVWWAYRANWNNYAYDQSVLEILVTDHAKNLTSTVLHLSPKALKND